MRAPITVIVTTYFPAGPVGDSRYKTCKITLQTWAKHLLYDGELRYCVVNSPAPMAEERQVTLQKVLRSKPVAFAHTALGVGASLNLGTRHATADGSPLTLYAADDWALDADVNLTPWADLLVEQETLGMVRLGPPHPDLTGTVRLYLRGWALKLDRHHFAFGHRPALYHQRMFDAYGWYDEQSSAWECERLYNEHFCRTPGPEIVYALPYPWRHVGEMEVGDHEPPVTERSET